MKTLLSTTALVVALGFPALTLAQTTDSDSAANSETQRENEKMSGFLAERSQSDLYASELIGHDVHAHRAQANTMASGDQATMNADGTQGMAMMKRADLDEMDNIGQINEIVLSNDGKVRALVIGVGGFLGIGEQDVAVTMDQITFASDADDQSQMYIVVNTGMDMLKNAPAYEKGAMRTDAAKGSDETDRTAETTDTAERNDGTTRTDDRPLFAAPQVEREGYDRVEVTDVSTEMLTGKTVYDVNENNVGEVEDMILDDDGKITDVIIDFGGFLGIGSSQASLKFKELTILTTDGYEDVRIYVDATKEQIQELPQYTVSE